MLLNCNFAFLIRRISYLQAGHFISVSLYLPLENGAMSHFIINKWSNV